MARRSMLVVAVGLAVGACGGDDGGKPIDASSVTEASIDAPQPPNCGADAFFIGENVNWDSTDAEFCGVVGARWTVRGDSARTVTTPPNGRVQLCLSHQAQTTIDIVPSGASSPCRNADGSAYTRRGVAIAVDAVIAASGGFSARAMTLEREAAMFTQVGASYDAAKGQLVVHVDGTPHAVSISAAHAAAQQWDGSAWTAASNTDMPVGGDVLFPNVAAGPVTITAVGGTPGGTTITLEADRFTYVAVIAN